MLFNSSSIITLFLPNGLKIGPHDDELSRESPYVQTEIPCLWFGVNPRICPSMIVLLSSWVWDSVRNPDTPELPSGTKTQTQVAILELFLFSLLKFVAVYSLLVCEPPKVLSINSYSNEFIQITKITMAACIPDGNHEKRMRKKWKIRKYN